MDNTERFNTTADDVVDERSLKEKIRDGWNGFKVWCGDHKEIVIIALPVLGALGKEMVKSHRNNQRIKAEDEKHNRSIYDRSNGHYIITKRDLTPSQQKAIDKRHKAGEDYYDILDDLNIKVVR